MSSTNYALSNSELNMMAAGNISAKDMKKTQKI